MTSTIERTVDGVKVGDVFYRSWGYEQTNVNWYVVVALTAKCIRIQECGSRAVSEDGPQVQVVPEVGRKFGPVMVKRVSRRTYNGRIRLAFNTYSNCYEWDGAAMSETGFGWGH